MKSLNLPQFSQRQQVLFLKVISPLICSLFHCDESGASDVPGLMQRGRGEGGGERGGEGRGERGRIGRGGGGESGEGRGGGKGRGGRGERGGEGREGKMREREGRGRGVRSE